MSLRATDSARVREGINPFERGPNLPEHQQMIEEGREATLKQIESLTECEVKFVQTVSRGARTFDQFSFRTVATAHRNQIQLFAKLEKLFGPARLCEGLVLVYVDQRRYDSRLAAPIGLDLTLGQSLLVAALILVLAALSIFVLAHLGISELAGHWLVRLVRAL